MLTNLSKKIVQAKEPELYKKYAMILFFDDISKTNICSI